MGRRRHVRLHHSASETDDVNGDMPEESTFFRNMTFDISSLRLQWGLLSIMTIRELDLSEEELSAMLLSQLDLRDTFIDTLNTQMKDIISKGHVLEEGYNSFKHEIWELERGDCGSWNSKTQELGEEIKDENDSNSWNTDKKFNVDDLNIKNEDNTDVEGNESSNEYHEKDSDKVSESSLLLASVTPVPELPNCSKNKSKNQSGEKGGDDTKDGKKGDDDTKGGKKVDDNAGDSEKDKFKAMVAMAFKAQGYGFLSGVKDKDDSNEGKLGKIKDEESISGFSSSVKHEDDSDEVKLSESKEEGEISSDNDSVTMADVGHGWSMEGEQSITQQVEAVASESIAHSGYEYQPELGLYYDHTSEYYYNAENGLYYDPKTGTYFYFDHTTHSYQFHSQVPVDTNFVANRKADQEVANTKADPQEVFNPADAADAYILRQKTWQKVDTLEDCEEENEAYPGSTESLANVPPSLRLMVTETGVEKVNIGDLHLVTINGGTIGRNKDNLVQLLDLNVSKVHAEIVYRSQGPDDHHYFIKDLGSNVGTFINGTIICIPGEPSDEIEIGHGWELQFGSIKMKCHMHPGYLSCNECEPGLVLANLPESSQQSVDSSSPKYSSVEKARKKILKAMRKKYALEGACEIPMFSSDYEDRAKRRRKEKGSDNPYEKTEVASTEVALRDNNKGFELLQKMGWSKGQSLGKSQPGITAPIETTSTVGREGLGFGGLRVPPPTQLQHKRKKILDVTTARFRKL